MRKYSRNPLANGIIYLVAGLIVFALNFSGIGYVLTGHTKDINDMIESGKEPDSGDYVSMKVKYVIDWYAKLTTTRRTTKITTYHCLAVLDNGKIISIGVSVNSDEFKKLNALLYPTYYYLTGKTTTEPTPVYIEGKIQKINSEISGYYTSALSTLGYTSSDRYMLNIDTTQNRAFGAIMLAIAIALMSVGGVLTYREVKKRKEEQEAQIINSTKTYVINDDLILDEMLKDDKHIDKNE